MGGRAHAHADASSDAFESEGAWADWVRDYYREIETYDWADVADNWRGPESIFHRNRRRVVRSLLRRYAAESPILDAGCGTGLNLASLPASSVAVDINPRNVAVVQQRFPQHRVLEADVEDLPFEDYAFGTVLCTEVLEHVPYPDRALAEFRRVLRPGGQLIGSVPARSLIWRFRFLSSTCPGDEPFHREYRAEQVGEMLGSFRVVHIWYSALRFNVMFVARRDS